MARESNRPTNTNYQDYLFDFSDVDFSQYTAPVTDQAPAGQTRNTEEPGILERLGHTALAVGEGLTMLPGNLADTVSDAWHGGNIDVTDTQAMQERQQRAREHAAYAQKYQGKAFEGVTDAMISLPYSLATLGASIGAGIPATIAAGPVAGGAAGMAASGAVAYRASKQEFMENMLSETSRVLGRMPTQEEWDRIATEFDNEATQYGLWEAGPEALGNLFFTKLLGPLGKGFLKDGMGKAVKRIAGLYGGEMGTETATQMGQGHIAAEMGWRDEAPGVLQALGEIAPATFWQTTLMAGGKKGLDLLAQRYGRTQVETADTPPPADFDTALGGPEWNPPAPRFDEAAWNREASERGWQHLRSDAAEITTMQPPSPTADVTETSLALDEGKPLDLLAPSPSEAPATPPALRQEPVVMPDMPRPAAAQPTVPPAAETAPPRLPSLRSNDGILAMLGQRDPFASQLSALPAPLPTQAQITRTQEAPRADTTAQAQALRLPTPDALPREAQTPTAPAALPAPVMPPQQTAAQQTPSLPMPAPQPTARLALPPAKPVTLPQELAGLSGREVMQRLPDQFRSEADFMETEEMRSLLAHRQTALQAGTPPAVQESSTAVPERPMQLQGQAGTPPVQRDTEFSGRPAQDFLRDHIVVTTVPGTSSAAAPTTSKEIEKSGDFHRVTSDADRPFKNSPDFYRSLLADYLKDKASDSTDTETPGESIRSFGQNSATERELDTAASVPAVSSDGNYGTVAAPDTVALAGHFAKIFLGGSGFGTIVEARREASSLLGGVVRPATEAAKAVDEAIELGVTLAARRIVADMRKRQADDTAIYRALVELYQRQPRLSVRTSTSIAQQAYSTPAPLAFLASRLAGIHENVRVFEPTAGNGMLLLEAVPERAVANELNPGRAARLRSQGFDVTEQDAVDFLPENPVDVVIANPPFGRVKENGQTREFSVNGLTTKELDHAIVARALSALKDGGRAVLIIGGKQGNDASRSRKYRAADQVKFWGWLFKRYSVLEHFSVDGKLYERQGAGYPIDIIVLENSGPSRDRAFPGAALPRVYTSFTALEEVLHGQVVDTAERESGSDSSDSGRTEDGSNQQRGRADRPADAARTESDRGRIRSGGNTGADGARPGERLDSRLRDDRPATTGGSRLQGSERPAPESGNDLSAVAEGRRTGGEGQADMAADSQRGDAGKRGGRDDAGGLGEHRDSGNVRSELGVESPQQTEKKTTAGRPKSTEFQVAYEPASTMQGMGTLVPRNMSTAVKRAMAGLERRHGSIDQYVADQLGYPVAELGNYFAAEQVDALGMAISNITDGSGFIIGDQTGIGKGRVNAGIIRWAKRQGYIPVFITMKPDLYADMVRDLADIGMEGFNPLPTNAELSGDKAILLPDGRTLKTRTAKAHEKILSDVMQNGMGAYDAVFTTYDQLNPVKGKDTFRRTFLMDIAPNAVFILDESHNAGGQAATRRKASDADDRAQFVRKMLKASHQGAFYSSATYAKRPDVMSLYFKTDMQYAADDMGKLAEAIERGGIPMQQVVAAALTETGQYLRRERSFEGAEVQTATVPIDKARAEKTADIMRAIMAFDLVKEEAVKQADELAARSGGSVGDNKSTGKGGASSTNFTAVMHNVIAQSLLAQKVDAVVEAAAANVAKGEKVVIALSNTMGSMIREFAELNGIPVGAPINFTFNDMFIRYLEKSRMITIKGPGESKGGEKRRLTDEELGPEGVRAYNAALEVIRKSDFGGLQVSVIDRLLADFESRGIRADEITGRTERIDYTTDVPTYAKRTTGPSDRIRVVDDFNAGKLDVVILNQAGSTGISLHSSERFKDQRRRNMIIAQAESNIDVFMQTLGRVFRTGQVVPPTYQLIMSDLPAEKRPAAVLAKKMASLNANTTASRDSDTSFKNIPDFLNRYGDKVAVQVMADNPELSRMLGSPVSDSSNTEDAMRKVTGRIPLLPVREQERLYAMLESEYNDYIAQLEAMGGSGLEAKSLPLDARLLEEVELVPAKDVGKDTPFAAAARLGTYDVKRLGKPWPAARVKEMVAAATVPDMEKLRTDALDWHRKKAGSMSDEAAENQLERLNMAYSVIAEAAQMRPGTPVLVTGNNTVMEGMLLRLYRKGAADNPLALGAWKMDIALPDASRKITIPLSQTIRRDDAFTVSESHRSPEALYALFDSGQKESRERVHIITGNILAAYQKVNGKGNVITFQDNEGNTIPGILLPRDADPKKILGEMDVSLSPEAALQFLRELPGKSLVRTADKLLSLSHDGTDFTITVPSSRAKGAQFFLNGAVLEAAGKDFIRSGKSMFLRQLSADQALGVMQALSAQGYGFVADNNREVAKKLMASAEQQIMASLASRPVRRPDSTPVTVVDVAPGIVPEFSEADSPIKALRKWLIEALANESTIIRDTGKTVRFTASGIRDSLKRSRSSIHRDTYANIKKLLESSVYDGFTEADERHRRSVAGQEIYWAAMNVHGKLYAVRFKLDVQRDTLPLTYKDHKVREIDISAVKEKTPSMQRPGRTSEEGVSQTEHAGVYDTNLESEQQPVKPHGERGQQAGTLREIEIAPILYREPARNTAGFTQTTEAISTISLGVLRDAVKPSRLENGALSSVQVAGQFLPPRFKGRRAPTVAAVRRLAEQMNSRAANAARVRVVETVADLPASFRDVYTSQTSRIEGMYDPTTDTVWLVAENLESLERAAEVWLHENMVHHGLRSALDAAQRRLLLNQLWIGMGGMMNADIRDIARRYGGDPRGNTAERMIIMEEVLAKMAERRAHGLLRSAQEQSLWRRIVDAIVRAWNNMVHSLTGRQGRMNRSQMEQLLDALQEHVMNGKPVAAMNTQGNGQDRTSLASLGESQEKAAHTAWRQLQDDMAAWGRQVDDFAAGKGNRVRALHVGRTPDVLVQLGARQLPMQMEQRNLRKILSKHDVPLETLKELPASLATPLMVFRSATMADAYVVLTEMERNGENLVAAIHFDVEAGRLHVNDIASVHDRSIERDGTTVPGWVWIKGQIEKGNLRYYDKTRSPRWFRERAGLQLSSVVNRGDYRGIRILTDKDVVKPEAPEDASLLSQADNDKSLAWARTNRLQLPQVRKLPARLSGNRILTENDVVKPEAPSGEAPLASLRTPSVSLKESAAAVVRQLRKIAGRGVSEDVEALLRDPEQGRLVPREDLGKMERLLKLPHWVAKDHHGFAAIYNRQLRRVDERRAAVLDATQRAPLLFDTDAGTRLNADEEQQLAAMIWKWDGKEIGPLHGIEKFIVTGTSLNGREELTLNPRYQEKFRAWLREQPEPERVREAFAQVRSLLDESFLHAYGRMSQMADLDDTDLEKFRTEMGNLPNYFPHQRRGRYYVEATASGPDGKRELVYRQHFDVPLGSSVREEWAKIVAANEKDYPGATWHNPKEVVQLPDDILGAPIDPQAMEQLINTTVQRQIRDGEQAEEVRKALLSGLSDVLKSRGFGAHAIQRKNIPGFDREDVKGILYNYISGLHGWLSKMDASADFAQALGKIRADKSPELWSFASQYVRDMLRNTDSIDRIAGNIKTVAFVWYLGGNIKTAVVNATQNLIVGVPRLQQEVTGGGNLWLKAAMDTLGLRFSGRGIRGARKLTADELRMLEELYGAGVIADAHMDEVRGQIARSPALRMWERLVRVLGMPMSIVEHFNRASLALAAYRAAKAGHLSRKACQRLGIREGEKLSHDVARDFADMLVRDTHFEYGKGNAPELLRSTTAGRMLSPAFVFRSYSGNILNLWWRALRHEGREGRIFVAKSLGATVALGGLTAFPFYATLSALCTALSGDDEDWTTRVRRQLPESNLLRDVVCYGMPALAGVTIGGSLRMETPFTEGIEKETTFKGIMTQSLVSLIGIPYDLLVNKTSRALEAHKYGADDRALEALVPTFMANIMQAYRLSTEGQTTLRGRPINSPGQPGARTLDTSEAVGKALGFQPTSNARSYAAYRADNLRAAVLSDQIDDFTTQALKDLESKGRPYMMRELRKRLQAWNAAREAEGKTGMRIMPKDVLRRVASRRRENSQSQEQRAKGAAQMALWGV